MRKKDRQQKLTRELIDRYAAHLREQEKSAATVQKYVRDLTALYGFLNGAILTKNSLIDWKAHLETSYAPASVNTMLAALNSLLDFCGWPDLKVKPVKIQRSMFCDEGKELTKDEYIRLIRAAQKDGNERLSLVIQTICATGIRVSELKFITTEAVRSGRADISNKGKLRTVFLPDKLCRLLKSYLQKQKRTAGPVFITKSGKPLDRSNIWRDMKALCESADVAPGKVFPHNLRHLFARTYYTLEKDLSRLADILGHSNVNISVVNPQSSDDLSENFKIATLPVVSDFKTSSQNFKAAVFISRKETPDMLDELSRTRIVSLDLPVFPPKSHRRLPEQPRPP